MKGGLGRRGDGRWCRFGGGCFQVLVPAYICQAKGNVCIIVSMSVLELKGGKDWIFRCLDLEECHLYRFDVHATRH